MGNVSTFDGGVFVHSNTELCIRCCDAELVTGSYRTGEWNLVGLDKSGNIYWRFESPQHIWQVRLLAGYIFSARSIVKKYSLEGNRMGVGVWDTCRSVTVDSSGNVYTCGGVYGGKNVRKYNSNLVLQWSIATGSTGGDTLSRMNLNYDESLLVVGGDRDATQSAGPYKNVFVLETSNGNEILGYATGWSQEPCYGVGFDAFDNIYVAQRLAYGSVSGIVKKLDINGNDIWQWFGADAAYVAGLVVGSEYVFVEKYDGKIYCLTQGEDPDNLGEPIEIWQVGDGTLPNARGGDGICLDANERLFTMSVDGICESWIYPMGVFS